MSTHLSDINRGSSVREVPFKNAYYTEENKTQSKDTEDYATHLWDELNRRLIFAYTWNLGPYHCSAALSVRHTPQLFCKTVAWKREKLLLNTFSTYINQVQHAKRTKSFSSTV